MKKIMSIALLLMVICTFVGCGQKYRCSVCKEEKSGKPAYVGMLLGEEQYFCDKCYKTLSKVLKK